MVIHLASVGKMSAVTPVKPASRNSLLVPDLVTMEVCEMIAILKFMSNKIKGADNCSELGHCSLVEPKIESMAGTAKCMVGIDTAIVQHGSLGKNAASFLKPPENKMGVS